MANKFVINNNEILMGNVELHEHLLGRRERNKTIGGGRFHIDKQLKKCYFYGKSMDFGTVTFEQFQSAWGESLISPFIEQCEILFSGDEQFYPGSLYWQRVFIPPHLAVPSKNETTF
jgi:hypothetical protein